MFIVNKSKSTGQTVNRHRRGHTDCKTMDPQKLGGNRKLVVCEHVDRFMRLPIGPHMGIAIT